LNRMSLTEKREGYIDHTIHDVPASFLPEI